MKVPTRSRADGPGTRRSSVLGAGHDAFQAALLGWYRARARHLSIRTSTDPWAILVAEVMAQQTQIARVDEAWASFMRRYPTPRSLGDASTAEVLRAWSGLGYNRRAVALRAAARLIETDHGGRVPHSIEALEALPGVGPYTARAVAALAFGQPVAAVDTNVRRVISRVFGGGLTTRVLQARADSLVPPDDPAAWTHATMDLGATICRSRRPSCGDCPVSRWCASAGRVEVARARSAGASGVPFEGTSRWLRGRVVAFLRDLEDGTWGQLPDTFGTHGGSEIAAAVVALESEGLLERGPGGGVRLPSGPR